MKRLLASTVLAIWVAGCGYAKSGTWEDDAANWERAFESTKPDDVFVEHSKYWRSPHFTMEFQYFFHVRSNDALRRQLFTENELKELDADAAARAARDFFGEKPAWFLPKPADAYEVWVFADRPQHFRLFVDRETGDLFLTDYVV